MGMPPVIMNQQYLELIKQLAELQQENIALRKQELSGQSNMSQVRRPEWLDATDGDWELFINTWTWFKDMCGLRDPAVIWNELRIACNPNMNRLLFDLIGHKTFNSATEKYLLHKIWLVAVKGLHKVYRQNFHSMRQKEGESVKHFLARLCAKAKFWEFSVACPNEMNCGQQVDYSNDMVAG